MHGSVIGVYYKLSLISTCSVIGLIACATIGLSSELSTKLYDITLHIVRWLNVLGLSRGAYTHNPQYRVLLRTKAPAKCVIKLGLREGFDKVCEILLEVHMIDGVGKCILIRLFTIYKSVKRFIGFIGLPSFYYAKHGLKSQLWGICQKAFRKPQKPSQPQKRKLLWGGAVCSLTWDQWVWIPAMTALQPPSNPKSVAKHFTDLDLMDCGYIRWCSWLGNLASP